MCNKKQKNMASTVFFFYHEVIDLISYNLRKQDEVSPKKDLNAPNFDNNKVASLSLV